MRWNTIEWEGEREIERRYGPKQSRQIKPFWDPIVSLPLLLQVGVRPHRLQRRQRDLPRQRLHKQTHLEIIKKTFKKIKKKCWKMFPSWVLKNLARRSPSSNDLLVQVSAFSIEQTTINIWGSSKSERWIKQELYWLKIELHRHSHSWSCSKFLTDGEPSLLGGRTGPGWKFVSFYFQLANFFQNKKRRSQSSAAWKIAMKTMKLDFSPTKDDSACLELHS